MWFKSIALFQTNFHQIELNETVDSEIESLAKTFVFEPCKEHDPLKMGWTAPLAQDEMSTLFYKTADCWLGCLTIQEKVLPAAAVNEKVAQKIEAIEKERNKPVSKTEKAAIKEEVYHSLLPLAFTRSKKVMGYLDATTGWLVLNTTNGKQSDLFLSYLRKTMPMLSISPIETQNIGTLLTDWLKTNSYPEDFVIEDTCVIKDTQEEGLIRCQRENLLADEILNLLEGGREVVQLTLSWQDQLRFTVTDDFHFKSIKFLEVLQDEAKDMTAETEMARFDADLAIMVRVFREWILAMLHTFQHPSEVVQDALEKASYKADA